MKYLHISVRRSSHSHQCSTPCTASDWMTRWTRARFAVHRRYTNLSHSRLPLIHVPSSSSIYYFGDVPPTSLSRKGSVKSPVPVIQDLQWTVHDGEAWAIVSSGSGKEAIFKTLLGHLRLLPPPASGLFPLLSRPSSDATAPSRDPYSSVSFVSFRHHSGGPAGAFYDYTARYGAIRDDDQRNTLLESMFPRFLDMRIEREGKFEWQREGRKHRSSGDSVRAETETLLTEEEKRLFRDLVEKTGLESLLDVPMVTLSNGQRRRARIAKAILRKPKLLLLDEPLTGLDHESRPRILELLRELHAAKKPRIIMGLRAQDNIPEWITHIAFVNKGKVEVGGKDGVLPIVRQHVVMERKNAASSGRIFNEDKKKGGKLVVEMKNVNIAYENRKVLSDISWTIRLGERWHLQGANGSGKSTLLSLLTGAHPLSFSLPHLELYGQKRSRVPTAFIQSRVGEMSPEMFDAFPRRMPGLSVWAAVGTGFEGAFVERGRESVGVPIREGGLGVGIREEGGNGIGWDGSGGENWTDVKEWRIKRCWEVLEALGPASWDLGEAPPSTPRNVEGVSPVTKEFAERRFTELSAGEQRIVLVMRALVGRPPLVLLDEALSGMSDGMVRTVKRYVSSGGVGSDQALVAISHWDEELPFLGPYQVYRLEGGIGRPLGKTCEW
ncbi:hypothetical protein AX15_000771 [Amanita polypyramis BW_CC]|nr:hypothetical protein AX15_000771 [Amanita polypyramis BW_CC]